MTTHCLRCLIALFLWSECSFANERGTFEVTYEVFSLPMASAAKLKRERLDGVAMVERILELVENGSASQEKFMVLKTKETTWGLLEEIEEYIYPTEYDPGDGLPVTKGPANPNYFSGLSPFWLPVVPFYSWFSGSYDTRNLGDSLEVELGQKGDRIWLSFQAKHIKFLKLDVYGSGVSVWPMPRFSAQRLHAFTNMPLGATVLLGTMSPPVELQAEEVVKKVWLAFSTVKKIKI